ncbi:NAD(P)-binding domain-containing protein [Staphylococcus pseudoxylosus]|uniref:NAD(P)-binding domain-containing protein n=1 Tax=Staphylococcus pseudoxylosus TaxID=2282419 RepID=UPI00398B39A7
MDIGFIGFGEVGKELSKGFSKHEVNRIYAYDPLRIGADYKKLSERTEINYVEKAEIVAKQTLSILFVAVPATKTVEAWSEISDVVANETVLVDLTTASSEEKNKINEMMYNKGMTIIDAAILGALKVYQNEVPILASGTQTNKFIELGNQIGMNITKLNEKVGAATNFKFVRSIFTKGLSALLFEVMASAEHLDITEEIYESITSTMDKDDFGEIINRYIKSNVKHSQRREKEMKNVSEFLEHHRIEPVMTKATIQKLKNITQANLESKLRDEVDDWSNVIKAYNQK